MTVTRLMLIALAITLGASAAGAQAVETPLIETCEGLACSARPTCVAVPVVLADGSLDLRTVCVSTPRR